MLLRPHPQQTQSLQPGSVSITFALAQLLGTAGKNKGMRCCVLLLCAVQDSLNAFMALGKPAWQEARATLTRLLSKDEGQLRDNAAIRQAAIIPQVSRCHYQAGYNL